jgi:hypothetical protein
MVILWRLVFIFLVCIVFSFITDQVQEPQHVMEKVKQTYRKDKIDNLVKTEAHRDPREQILAYWKLHKIYYDGVPDQYDRAGNKIKGVVPDPKKCISSLWSAINIAGSSPIGLQLMVELGDIYQHGMYNLEPDLDQAINIYTQVLNQNPSGEIGRRAHDGWSTSSNRQQELQTYRWLNLPVPNKPSNAHHQQTLKRFNMNKPARAKSLPPNTIVPIDDFFLNNIPNIDDARRNDMHNTHNPQVVSTMSKSVQKLRESLGQESNPVQTVQEVRKMILSRPPCDRREDALKSLDSIERNYVPLMHFSNGLTETLVLDTVWKTICKDEHQKSRKDLTDILYQQLADMQEHGKSVCATGRVSRLVDTLSGFDKNVSIKPTYVIDEEMLTSAAKIRDNYYTKIKEEKGEIEAKKYEDGTASDQDDFDETLRKMIKDKLRSDYVDSKILTDEKFEKMTEKWINDI